MAEQTPNRRATVPVAGLVVLATGLALMGALSLRATGRLPDPVRFVGTGRNGADQQAPRVLVLAGIPLLTLAISTVLLLSQWIRRATASMLGVTPWRDERTHRRNANLGLGLLVPVLLALHVLVLQAATGDMEPGLGFVAAAVALVMVVGGNMWPKRALDLWQPLRARLDAQQRYQLEQGLEAQRRALRPTGIAMVMLGLVALALSWLAPLVSLGVSLTVVATIGVVLLATAGRSVAAARGR